MDTALQTSLTITAADDAFWRAMGGTAWEQWQERTRGIIRENQTTPDPIFGAEGGASRRHLSVVPA